MSCWAQRSASQYRQKMHSAPTTRPSRGGSMASRQRSGSQRRLRCRTAGAASPPKLRYLDADMVTVYETGDDGKKRRLATLLWGDSVRLVGKSGDYWKLDFTSRQWNEETRRYYWKRHDAFISGRTKFRDESVLKVRFVGFGVSTGVIVTSRRWNESAKQCRRSFFVT